MASWAGGFSKFWNVHEFEFMETYLKNLIFNPWRPRFIVLHNTGSPTLERWLQTDELQRIKNLEHFYRDIQSWSSGPHFFVSPTRVFEGTPCNKPGTHSPSWNHLSIGIEMAGDYETEPFDPRVRSNTVKLMSILYRILGLDPADYKKGVRGLHFHKEDPATTHKTCPGKNVVKGELVKEVVSGMKLANTGDHQLFLDMTLPIKRDTKDRVQELVDKHEISMSEHVADMNKVKLPETPADDVSDRALAAAEAHKTAKESGEVKPYPLTKPPSPFSGLGETSTTGEPAEPVDLSARQKFPSILGDKILRSGSINGAVAILQQILQDYGYIIKNDGLFGPATDSAVRDFQRKANLTVDGEVGPVTARVLADGTVSPHPKEVPFPHDPSIPVPTPKLVDSQPMWLVEGLSLLGTEEGPGSEDNPQILEWAKEEGGDIAKVYKHDSVPWCSLFCNYLLTKVGLPGTGTLWALDFLTTKSLVTLPGPAVGAFAPMKREGGGHIALVLGRDPYGNLMCLGGNQNDSVSIEPFPRDRPLAFRWPKGVTLPKNIGFDTLPLVDSDGKISIKED